MYAALLSRDKHCQFQCLYLSTRQVVMWAMIHLCSLSYDLSHTCIALTLMLGTAAVLAYRVLTMPSKGEGMHW